MAFDHPVEADRVELNFGSIMARAPVIGSLMYLLGGHHAREEEEYESSLRKEITDDKSKMNSQNVLDRSNRTIKSVLKKSSPSLAPTDNDSDNESFQSALDSDRHNAIFGSESSLQRKKKELSWSDESGQNLVEYMDACTVSASKDEHSVFVQGSMMTRTRSIRHQLEENQAHSHRRDKSYLPRMAPQGGGVVMPTMRDNQPHGGGGIESPQWGWYTNLTPPSPEMYTSNPFHKKHNISSTSTASTASDASAPMSHSCSKPNPVFQSLPSQRQKNQTGRHQPTLPV